MVKGFHETVSCLREGKVVKASVVLETTLTYQNLFFCRFRL